ncbi:MAG: apolipoprotein N-acyltransferase [Ilumatobacteraceae bacterium]
MPDSADERSPLGRLALAALAGSAVAGSLPPWGFWPLAFVGIALFESTVGDDLTRRWRVGLACAFAGSWMLIGMAWMWYLTAPGYIVTSALFAALHGVAAAVAPTGRWRVIGRAAAHTLAEIVRMLVPFGGVPLATLGIAQAGGPLIGVARVGGVILLTWLVFQLGFAAGALIRAFAVDRDVVLHPDGRPAAVAIGVAVIVAVAAVIAPTGRDLGVEPLTVAAVQGGGEQGTSALEVASVTVTQAHLDATSTIESSPDLGLVVWPENAIDVNDAAFEDSAQFAAVAAEADRLGAPFAVGVTLDSEFSAHPSADSFVNAQYVVAAGRAISGYEKVRIVPFGEYVPFRGVLEALGAPLDQIASDATRGRDPGVIELPNGTRVGVMISWEVFFGDRGRAAEQGALLLNPTNGASYTGTIVQTQQVASSRLRAVETGRWVVQVSPTGFSAFVSPDGTVLQRTAVGERRVITMAVPLREGTTWYSALGDGPWIAAVVVGFGLSLWFASPGRVRRVRRTRPRSPDPG